jgi:hypothetical protein
MSELETDGFIFGNKSLRQLELATRASTMQQNATFKRFAIESWTGADGVNLVVGVSLLGPSGITSARTIFVESKASSVPPTDT